LKTVSSCGGRRSGGFCTGLFSLSSKKSSPSPVSGTGVAGSFFLTGSNSGAGFTVTTGTSTFGGRTTSGRGGGSTEMIQGSMKASRQAIEAYFREQDGVK
jgi:hypothetical protein